MAEPFKNRFNKESLQKLSLEIKRVYDSFLAEEFINSIMDETWDLLEYKSRVLRIAQSLGGYLPKDFKKALAIIDKVILNYEVALDGFVLFFPTFVELYGTTKENIDLSLDALARYTKYATAEFAIRTFLVFDEEKTLTKMLSFTQDESEHIRRLASEGCRPRLPWGKALPRFQENPTLILPILEQLKSDESEYVRKSVANNLNDISKTHPDFIKKIAKEWYGKDNKTDWILKHGCRTLLKKGDSELLALFGFENKNVLVTNFNVSKQTLAIGENIVFSFTIQSEKKTKVRLEYEVGYKKANGKGSCKIFQISELILKENEPRTYAKTHSFKDNSVRKHYPGKQSICLIVNGIKQDTIGLELLPINK